MVLVLQCWGTSSSYTSHTADTNRQHHVAGHTNRIVLALALGFFQGGVHSCSRTAQVSGYLAFRVLEALKPFECIVVCPNCERSSVEVVAEMLDSVHHGHYLLLGGAVLMLTVLKHSAGVCNHFLISVVPL